MRLSASSSGVITALFIAVLALAASILASMTARNAVAVRILSAQEKSALAASQRQPSIFYAGRSDVKPKIGFTMFVVTDSNPQKPDTAEAAPAGNIENFKLVGTLPPVGAWVEAKNSASLVLKGGIFDGYTLESIEPGSAVFSREGQKYPVYLVYRSQGDNRDANAQQPRVDVNVPGMAVEPPPAQVADMGGIVQARANGEDGAITREMLNELLVNPLAEVCKMRLIPSENGMMIAGMRSYSLFSKLGMKPKDVITNINGIAISDVGNVSNVISSMMSGARFDFQVQRDGAMVRLGYAVK